MTRIVNQPVETKVQALDINRNPVEDASVSYKIYDSSDILFDSGSMSHTHDGIYSISWIPVSEGEWTVECYSEFPKFTRTFCYFIEYDKGGKYVWNQKLIAVQLPENYVVDEWVTLCDLKGGIKADFLNVSFYNENVETTYFEIEAVINGTTTFIGNMSLTRSLNYTFCTNGYEIETIESSSYPYFVRFGSFVWNDGVSYNSPIECDTLKIRFRVREDLPESLYCRFSYYTLTPVTSYDSLQTRDINSTNYYPENFAVSIKDIDGNVITQIKDGQPFEFVIENLDTEYSMFCVIEGFRSDGGFNYSVGFYLSPSEIRNVRFAQYEDTYWEIYRD